MRKTIFLALVSVAALGAVAPGANAATATFMGNCAFTGVATFDPTLTGTHQTIKYDFKSGAPAQGVADATKCSGTLNGKAIADQPVVAQVAGMGELSCADGASVPKTGKGSIAFPDGSTFPFGFEFSAVLTEVTFEATFSNGVKAAGHASFANYAPPTSVFDCSPAGSGIKSLGFDATSDAPADGRAAEGTKPDPAPQGGSGPGASDRAKQIAAKRKACQKKAKKIKNKKKRAAALKRCKRIK